MRFQFHPGARARTAIAAVLSAGLAIAGIGTGAGAETGPAATPQPVQSYNTYKSWFVACDNELACVAKGVTDAGADITIERQGGPTGTLVALIQADHAFNLADIRIDGQPMRLSAPGPKTSARSRCAPARARWCRSPRSST